MSHTHRILLDSYKHPRSATAPAGPWSRSFCAVRPSRKEGTRTRTQEVVAGVGPRVRHRFGVFRVLGYLDGRGR